MAYFISKQIKSPPPASRASSPCACLALFSAMCFRANSDINITESKEVENHGVFQKIDNIQTAAAAVFFKHGGFVRAQSGALSKGTSR
jgi:hypothetical protein